MNEVQKRLASLQEVRWQLDRMQREMQPYTDREAELRSEIQRLMQEGDVKTVEHDQLQAQRANRTTTVITDKDELTSALRERGLYEQCVRLDLNEAKKVGIANEMPGIEKQTSEVFSIRSAK